MEIITKNHAKKQELTYYFTGKPCKWGHIDKRCKELNELWGTNMEVDHVIPLRGKLISGLHVWDNLQLLDRLLNTKKGNKFNGNEKV